MADASEEIAQLIKEARRRDETLSGLVSKYPADWDDVLSYLDSMLEKIPEPLRPVGLLDLRKIVETKKSQAQQATDSVDGQEDWTYLMGLISSPAIATPATTTQVTQEISLPPSLRNKPVTMTTAEASRLISKYLMKHPNQEIGYDVARTVIPSVTGKQFNNVMTQIKSKPGFSGSYGTVKYEGARPARKDTKAPGLSLGAVSDAAKTYTPREGSIISRFLAYVNSLPDGVEKTFDEIGKEPQFRDVEPSALSSSLYTLKKRKLIEGGSSRAKKKSTQSDGQTPAAVPEYRADGGAQRAGVMDSQQTTPADAFAKVKGYLFAHPRQEFDYETLRQLFPEVTGTLFSNTMTRIKQLDGVSGNRGGVQYVGDSRGARVAVALPTVMTDAPSAPEQGINNISRLQSYYGIDPIMDENLPAARSPRAGYDAAPVAVTPSEDKLSPYAGMSAFMDEGIDGLRTIIDANHGEKVDRLSGLAIGILESGADMHSKEQALHRIVSTLKELAGSGRSIEPLLKHLEAQERDPAKVLEYLDGAGQERTGVVRAESESVVNADLSRDPYWSRVFSPDFSQRIFPDGRGEAALRQSVTYMVSRDSRYERILRQFLGEQTSQLDGLNAWKYYGIDRIYEFMRTAEQTLGKVPAQVRDDFLAILKQPDAGTYLNPVFREYKNGKHTLEAQMALLHGIATAASQNRGQAGVAKALSRYHHAA